ncbi:MAG: hypothetical protein WCJ35_25240 [Planctomycetota bacterium]
MIINTNCPSCGKTLMAGGSRPEKYPTRRFAGLFIRPRRAFAAIWSGPLWFGLGRCKVGIGVLR